MSLNPDFSAASASTAPDAKLTFNVNAFNGNTTNFGRCATPKPKAMAPVQPMGELPFPTFGTPRRPGTIMPM